MAKIVMGIGTSHSPMMSSLPENWAEYAMKVDPNLKEICFAPDGAVMPFEDALVRAKPEIAELVDLERFVGQHANLQNALAEARKTFNEVKPDIAVIFSDDQDENLFEDNMPTFSVYWGDTIRHEMNPMSYATKEQDVPVPSDLGRHVIEHMMENDFDVAHSRYLRKGIGGTIVRRYPSASGGEIDYARTTEPRTFGLPHGWGFIVNRIMDSEPIPILPISVNTCYPPNQPTPKRCFNFGREVRRAIESWDSDLTVAVMASGGLSHFSVDEELDRTALKGMVDNDAEVLSNLPRHRLRSAASETLNWVTAAGAMEHLKAEVLAYEPVYRTPAGTGGGWSVVRWTANGA